MFKKLAVPLALLVTLGTSGALSAFASGSYPSVDDYLIRNTATGRYLTAADGLLYDGNFVIEYAADGIGYGNLWTMETTEDGQIIFASGYDSDLVLTCDARGWLVLEEREDGNTNQQFTMKDSGDAVTLSVRGKTIAPAAYETAAAWLFAYDPSAAFISIVEEHADAEWELVPVTNNPHPLGDVNRDGIVDIFDLGLAKRLLLNNSVTDVEQIALANVDVNSNSFDVADIILLSQYLLGTRKSLSDWAIGYHFTANTLFPGTAIFGDVPVPPTEPETQPTEPETQPTEPETETTESSEPTVLITDADTFPLGEPLSVLTEDMQLVEKLTVSYQSGDMTFAVFTQQPERTAIAMVCADEIVGYYCFCNDYDAPEGYRVTAYYDDQNGDTLYAVLVLRSDMSIAFSKLTDYSDMSALSKLNFYATNGVRAINGLPSYQWDETLAKAALAHSEEMAEKNYMDHNSYDGAEFYERFDEVGIRYWSAGENIDGGKSDVFDALDDWYNSKSGHRYNLLDEDFTHMGVGFAYGADSRYKFYGTQDFYQER